MWTYALCNFFWYLAWTYCCEDSPSKLLLQKTLRFWHIDSWASSRFKEKKKKKLATHEIMIQLEKCHSCVPSPNPRKKRNAPICESSQNSRTLYLQRWDVIVWDELKARHVGAKTFVTTGVCRAGDGRHSAAPEVSLWKKKEVPLFHAILVWMSNH